MEHRNCCYLLKIVCLWALCLLKFIHKKIKLCLLFEVQLSINTTIILQSFAHFTLSARLSLLTERVIRDETIAQSVADYHRRHNQCNQVRVYFVLRGHNKLSYPRTGSYLSSEVVLLLIDISCCDTGSILLWSANITLNFTDCLPVSGCLPTMLPL